ncbi:MAG: hypothetical protein M1838_001925 [Thelocarpon superellum]|nr:MAG: hypothetical protein M1838_001925 [Thelocarpon superellum]
MRSPADATRFTATGPVAHSRAALNSSRSAAASASRSAAASASPSAVASSASAFPTSSSSPPTGESAQAKVTRLKNAARQARLDQVSTFDKVIVTGRTWADRAHRFVALGLIGATAICGIYATVALGDMVLYNRRRRSEFYAAQRELYTTHVAEAREAVAAGEATPQQTSLVEHEDGVVSAAREKAAQKGMLGRAGQWLFAGLKKDEPMTPRQDGLASANENQHEDEGSKARAEASPAQIKAEVMGAFEKAKQREEQEIMAERSRTRTRSQGGMLDQLGARSSPAGAWSSATSWLVGRGSSSSSSSLKAADEPRTER